MDTLPPYTITVYNRVAQRSIGSYRSNQVPSRGDQISFYGDPVPDDPFENWGRWKVDEIVWEVSQRGSHNANQLARTHHSTGEAACLEVELHVWPAQGPYWWNTPKWANATCPPGWRDEPDDEDDDPLTYPAHRPKE